MLTSFILVLARMADKGKRRVITIQTDNEMDSFVGGVRAKNTDKSLLQTLVNHLMDT